MTMWNMGTVVNVIDEEMLCNDITGMTAQELVWSLNALTGVVDTGLALGNMPYTAHICIDLANAYLIEIGKRVIYHGDKSFFSFGTFDIPEYMKNEKYDKCDFDNRHGGACEASDNP